MSQQALDALPFPIALFTCSGDIAAVNALARPFLSAPHPTVLESLNVLAPESPLDDEARRLFVAAAHGQTGHAAPAYSATGFPGARSREGREGWIETSYLPFSDTSGRVTHVGIMARDVTDRVEAEQRSRTLTALIDHARDGIGLVDPAGTITYSNPAFQALSGYGASLNGVALTTLHQDDPMVLQAAMAQVQSDGHWRGTLAARRPDGSSVPIEVSAVMLPNSAGAPSAVGAIIRDLREREAQEQRLGMFQILVENAAIGMALTDTRGVFIYANAALRDAFGYGEDIVGMAIPQLLSPEDQAMFAPRMAELFTNGRMSTEARFVCRDGSARPIAVAAILITDINGAPLATAAVVRDLTAEQRAEQERILLQEQVISAQQAAIRELSTPLIPIAAGVVAMPLIGTIDTSRAQLVIETLLAGVAELRAHTTILDITGVPVVDTQVANALLQAAQAVKLLGARVILTGIRPEVAQTLVGLGIDLSGIDTRGTFQSGIADALARALTSERGHAPGLAHR